VKMCRDLVMVCVRNNGRGKNTWQDCVNEDMKQMGLRRCDAQDRTIWKNIVLGNV